jgi:hypothetical protein
MDIARLIQVQISPIACPSLSVSLLPSSVVLPPLLFPLVLLPSLPPISLPFPPLLLALLLRMSLLLLLKKRSPFRRLSAFAPIEIRRRCCPSDEGLLDNYALEPKC